MEAAIRARDRSRSRRWAARLLPPLALAFLVWHGTSLIVAPYPESELLFSVRPAFEPYLRFAYLDHRWTFFGPRPDAGRQVRYQVVRSGGEVVEFRPSEAQSRRSPAYFRWLRLFDRVTTGRPELRESAVGHLCRVHEALEPRGIRFIILHQLMVRPEEYLAGARPTDAEAQQLELLAEIPCRERMKVGE